MGDSPAEKTIEKKYCPVCYQQFEAPVTQCPDDHTALRDPSRDPLVGKVFAERYEILSVLGLGGMSIVYKARHRLMDRIVAIKMLHSKLKEDITALERFKLEAQAASSLNHPNIIGVHDFGVTPDGEPFFVMDYLEGENLKELIDRKGKLPYQRALPIFRQICEGLDAAHRKKIVHRDLKPANVVLIKQDDGTEQVKLVDFGVAKILSGNHAQHLTQAGEVFGSPIYMSPEQCMGKELDIRSDIYSLGCVMYETLAGVPPFVGDGFLDTMNRHVGESAKLVRVVAPDAKIPDQIEQIIARCLEKSPDSRFQTAAEVRDTISAVTHELLGSSGLQSGFASMPVPVARVPSKKPPGLVILSLVMSCFLLVGFAFCAFWPGPPEDSGTLLNKVMWQFALNQGTESTERGQFEAAQSSLKRAESLAKTFGDRQDKLEMTMRAQADLYGKWEGHARELEAANLAINQILIRRLMVDYQLRMKVLDGLDQKPETPVVATELKLKAEAEIPAIILVAAKLHGKGSYDDEERLLTKALKIERRLVGGEEPALAPLEERLADCLIQQSKFSQVRSLLIASRDLRSAGRNDNAEAFVRAENKLGQFDLDQSNFKDAHDELEVALADARKLNVSKDLLSMCMRSYAELLRQTDHKDESKKLLLEAEKIEGGD